MPSAVIDNTVLSNFARIHQPDVLASAFAQPITVEAVMAEFTAGVSSGRVPTADWSWLPVIKLSEAEQVSAIQLGKTLGHGESECIAVAASRSGIIVTDDRDARRTAQMMGIAFSGTLGALMNLVSGQTLSLADADQYLNLMKQQGYHAPVSSLSELIDP